MPHNNEVITTRHNQIKINPLLVIGGQSSRMGTPKHLLRLPDGRTALEHAIETLHAALPEERSIYLSLRGEDQLLAIQDIIPPILFEHHQASSEVDQGTQTPHHDHSTTFQHAVILFDGEGENIGPASALRSAHASDPSSTWLIVGCDYPLLPASAILQLIMEYTEPASCFMQKDEQGKEWLEPLLSIWSPEALQAMSEAIAGGLTGPTRVLKQMRTKEVWPLRSEWIKGANTPEEWQECLRLMHP